MSGGLGREQTITFFYAIYCDIDINIGNANGYYIQGIKYPERLGIGLFAKRELLLFPLEYSRIVSNRTQKSPNVFPVYPIDIWGCRAEGTLIPPLPQPCVSPQYPPKSDPLCPGLPLPGRCEGAGGRAVGPGVIDMLILSETRTTDRPFVTQRD